ncbi:hypothetical protein [[Clostridium] hylemonae]|uniref:hypothetical protein n=1 Tax=[Clostridium] hylemonae TaxID=89153 RepID=UPI0011EE82A6|nr:hypothetical protein [[Clostridium] hylemonae]
MYYRDLKIIGSYALQKTMQQSIEMIGAQKVDLRPLVGEVITLDEMPEAFGRFMEGKTEKKTIVAFD